MLHTNYFINCDLISAVAPMKYICLHSNLPSPLLINYCTSSTVPSPAQICSCIDPRMDHKMIVLLTIQYNTIHYITLQLRIDFTSFVITGPSTLTLTTVKAISGGTLSTLNGVEISYATNCLTDKFSVTSSGGGTSPVICGTNNNVHSK